MSEPFATDQQVPRPPVPATGRTRAAALVRTFVFKVFTEPVRTGRLRNVGWPQGLRAVVTIAMVALGTGILLVVLSGPLRSTLELTPVGVQATIPRALVWLLTFLVVLSMALWQTAALRGPVWLRVVTACVSGMMMTSWGWRVGFLNFDLISLASTAALVALLIVLIIRSSHRPFRWWEFPAVLGILGTPVVLSLLNLGSGGNAVGEDLSPVLLATSAQQVSFLAVPAAFAAGTAVAQVTTSATLWAGTLTARYAAKRTTIGILIALLVGRLVQAAWEVSTLDPVHEGWEVIGATVVVGLGLGTLIWAILRRGRRRGAHVHPADLPQQLARFTLPVGGGLLISMVPATVMGLALVVVGAMHPRISAWIGSTGLDAAVNIAVIDAGTLALAAVVAVAAIRRLQRNQVGSAALLAGIAVMLVTLTSRTLSSGYLTDVANLTVLNLTATAVTIVLGCWLLIRRTLTGPRAAGLGSLLVFSALFAHRDLIDDPLSALFGFSGAAFIIFGLIWTLLTSSAAANAGSRRFPLPTRVLFLMGNVVLTSTVLAIAALARGPDADLLVTSPLDYSTLGNLVAGTALLMAVFVGVLSTVKRPGEDFGHTPDLQPRPENPAEQATRARPAPMRAP